MHEYPIEGMEMPSFVTNDGQNLMIIEVNYAPGDRYLIGYRSVRQKAGSRIPRKNARTSTVVRPLKPYDIGVSPDVSNYVPERYDYRPSPDVGTVYSYSPPLRPGSESPGLFGRVSPSSNDLTTSRKTVDQYQDFKTDESASHLGENNAYEELDQKSENKKGENFVILGLLWTVAIVIVIAVVSIVAYIKYKDEINSIRRRTEQGLKAVFKKK